MELVLHLPLLMDLSIKSAGSQVESKTESEKLASIFAREYTAICT